MTDEFCMKLVIGSLVVFAGLFLWSFLFKTAWGAWDNRRKADEIYGKPGANMDEIKRRHAGDRK